MLSRVSTFVVSVLALCLVAFPSHSKLKTADILTATTLQDSPLTLSTTKFTKPDGSAVVWNLQGRYQNAGRVVNLRTTTIKPSCNNCGINPGLSPGQPNQPDPEQPPEPDQRDTDYYYSNSDMSNSSGSVMVAATYQFEEPTNRNVLYMTVGGVTITLDLNTLEMLPLTEVDQQRLEEWANTEEAALALDTLMAIVAQGWDQPFEVLQNYYALAVLFETGSDSSARMQPKGSRKVVLHHAVRKLKSPNDAMSRPCPDQTIAAVNTSGKATSALMRIVTPQGHQCCGWGNNCIRDRYNAPIYGAPCVNHDRCVGGRHLTTVRQCAPSLVRAIVYVWYRNTEWGAFWHYNQ